MSTPERLKVINKEAYERGNKERPAILAELTKKYGNRSRNDLAIAIACEQGTWEDTFSKRVKQEGDCLIWQLSVRNNGYGQMAIYANPRSKNRVLVSSVSVHRLSYAMANGIESLPYGHQGPKPHTLVIDHICNNRLCVNPEHLQVITQAENMKRRYAA